MPHQQHVMLYFLRNRELNELYLTITIRAFAISMIGIFIPIFLLQLNYSLPQVMVFFVILAGVHSVSSLPAAKLSSRFGFKHSILFSRVLWIIALLFLITLEQINWPLYVPAILLGVSGALFWVGYHVDFAKFSDKKKRGREVSISKIASSLFNVLGPLVGGIILVFFGFASLFVFASVLMIVGVVPLFFSKDIHNPIEFSLKELFKGQKIKDGLSFIGAGIESGLSQVMWPIFIFFLILGEQYTSLGLVSSLSLFFSFLLTFAVGKFSDVKRGLVLKIGAITNAIVWIFRAFVKTTLHVFVIDSFGGISKTLIGVPFEARSYDKANKSNIVRFIAYRETIINASRAVFFVVMIFVADLASSFIFGGSAGSLLHLLF